MAKKKTTARTTERKTALCYIRLSVTKNASDLISPERQRANITAACERNGWIPEWYEDAEGHKPGTKEANRPAWLALKARLGDPDIAALVANDLARLHRSETRIKSLLTDLDAQNIALVMADPLIALDMETPEGRHKALEQARLDEWYAQEISQRWCSDIAYRKAQGKTVGLPPFGTKRDKSTGYLIPSDEGAWYMPDGTWQPGYTGDTAPVSGAIWRGYYDCAERMLTLYADDWQRERLCRQLQAEGWAFRDRQGLPSPIEVDDIRRVVSNWPEYGGYVSSQRARERLPRDHAPETIIPQLNPERAVFPLELLAEVSLSRQKRAYTPHLLSATGSARTYALSGITHCAHCESLARQHNRPALRSRLSGRLGKFYRHKPGGACGCKRQSVPLPLYERQFSALVAKLTFNDNAQLTEDSHLTLQHATLRGAYQQRVQAITMEYVEGKITTEQLKAHFAMHQRQYEQQVVEAATMHHQDMRQRAKTALDDLRQAWVNCEKISAERRQATARAMFSNVIYNLDEREIVGYAFHDWLQPWIAAG